MSERDSVRRLFESAIMKARAVISEMKTICVYIFFKNDGKMNIYVVSGQRE